MSGVVDLVNDWMTSWTSLMLGESGVAGVEMASTAALSAACSSWCSRAAATAGVGASPWASAALTTSSVALLLASPVQNEVGRIVTFSHWHAR